MKNIYKLLNVIPGLAAILFLASFSQNMKAQLLIGQPRDVTIFEGHSSSVFFSVDVNPDVTVTFQWFLKDPGASTGNPIEGAETAVLEVPFTDLSPASTKFDGDGYYCVVTDLLKVTETSLHAYLWVQPLPKVQVVTGHPLDVTRDVGFKGEVNFNVEVTAGLKADFLWSRRDADPGAVWKDVVGSGPQYTELLISLDPKQNGTAYRCQVKHADGGEFSQVAYLWARVPKLLILTEPVDVTRPEGFVGTITFDITPNPEYEPTFQWEFKLPGGDWQPYKGGEKPLLEFPIEDPLNSKLDGTAFRCIARSKEITEVSETAYLRMEEANIYILQDPEDVMKKEGFTGVLNFAIKYDDAYPLVFQWQEKKPGGSWVDISLEHTPNKPELYYKIEKLSLGMNGWGFRCVAINNEAKEVEYSKEANLYVSPDIPYILDISGNVTVCEGAATDAKFSVKIEQSVALSLQWQISPAGDKNWYDIKGATSELYVKSYTEVPLSHNSNAFRCRATDEYGGFEISDIAFLNVRALPTITTHPVSQEKMVGEAATFNVAATGYKPFYYQWYKDGGAITGNTTSSLSLFPLSESDGADYRVIVRNYCANSNDTSNAATLVVNAPLFDDGWFEQEIVTSKKLTDIKFTGTNSGWVTVAPSLFIYKTVDGGKNWSSESVTTSKSWEAVFTTDANHVWIAGEDSIKYSTLGGGTWIGAAMNGVLSAINLFDLYFVDNSNGWAVGDNGLILNTSDGGANWSEQHSGDNPNIVTDVNLSAVHFFDADSGWTVGALGKILFTDDGGASWALQTSGVSDKNFLDVHFISSKTGWVVGSDSIFLSTVDGGQSWDPITSLNTSADLTGVHFDDADHGWVITSNGMIFRTNDGGISWFSQASGTSLALNAIDFADYDNGWVVGDNGTILRTAYSGCLTPTVSLFEDKEFCASVNYQLVADTFANNVDCSYLWSHGGTTTGTYNVTESGKFWVRVTSVCGVVVSDTVNVVLYPLPEPYAGTDQEICDGDSVQLLATGGVEYSWDNAGLLDDESIQNPKAGPPVGATDFIVTVTDENLCENTDVVKVTVYSIPNSTFTSPDEICLGDSAAINYTGTATSGGNFWWDFDERSTVSSGDSIGPYGVSWDTAMVYSVELVVEENGCSSDTSKASLTVHPIPVSTFSLPEAVCNSDLVTALYGGSVSGDATFTWDFDGGVVSEGDANGPGPIKITWATEGTKTVSLDVSDHGCGSAVTEEDIIVSYPFNEQSICLVTVDLETGKNAIIWEKQSEPGIDFYNIYRESNVGGVYDLIATFPADTLSYYVDVNSEPELKSHKYRVSVVDTCGNESDVSLYHKSMLLTTGLGSDRINVSWTEYEVEGTGFGFVSYIIYRGPAANMLEPIDTIPADNTLYPDINPPDGNNFYQVAGVAADACSPSGIFKAGTGPYSHSLTNLDDNKLKESDTTDNTTVRDVLTENNQLRVYPNPFYDQIKVDYLLQKNADVSIEVFNLLGVRVFEVSFADQVPGLHSYDIRATELDGSSIYYLRFKIDGRTAVKKLIPAR